MAPCQGLRVEIKTWAGFQSLLAPFTRGRAQ